MTAQGKNGEWTGPRLSRYVDPKVCGPQVVYRDIPNQDSCTADLPPAQESLVPLSSRPIPHLLPSYAPSHSRQAPPLSSICSFSFTNGAVPCIPLSAAYNGRIPYSVSHLQLSVPFHDLTCLEPGLLCLPFSLRRT